MNGLMLESLGWALLHSLWQGTLVALGLGLALATVGRRASNARYALALGALVLAVALPVATGARHYLTAGGRVSADGREARIERGLRVARMVREQGVARAVQELRAAPASVEGATDSAWGVLGTLLERAREAVDRSLRWLVLAWVAGVGLCSGRLTAEWVKLRLLAKRALPAPAEWQERLDVLSRRLGLARAVRLLQTTEVDVPAAVGWLSPVVLLPMSTLMGLPARQLEMVLAHELAHIRRHDFVVNLAQVFVETLFFFHPAVQWMSQVVRVEREHCCDDVAVGASGNSLSYARALTALETLRVMPDTLPGPAMSALGGSLPERVRRLVATPSPRCSSRWVAGASVLTLVSSLAVAAPLTALVLGQTSTSAPAATSTPTPTSAVIAPPAPPAPPAPVRVAMAAPAPAPAPRPAPAPAPAPAAPRPVRDDVDARTKVGSGQPLSVDQLVELKVAGVTPEKVDAMVKMGFEPTVSNLVEMGHAGITPEYVKEMNARFGRQLDVDTLVELRHLGVTPEYIQALKSAGFSTDDPDELTQARAVGVDAAYVEALRAAGYSKLTLEQVSELRAVGVDAGYVRALDQRGLRGLAADDLQQLRAVGVTPDWLDSIRSAGVKTLDPEQLTELRALGVSLDFLVELRHAGLENLSPDELVKLRAGGVDADFIRRIRGTKP
ncbi:M48 family metalloprotease [Myxococcus sp. K15C18031901]|uniref:M56 family metallopeptidase n=1 Tax=Myxococcus dinghuensis TaxID=2906761 RepID=UPI0020A79809|nr:M56 family metallopeptidase [Myxococcus dinghuensis]MCP3099236.1 M48 family metalloprotease [Myxococcus dinghuensis]